MAVVRTTIIRVHRSTQKRLVEEAKLAGTSMTEMLDAAVDVLEEQRLLDGAVRSWEKQATAVREETQW
ncbi:MAG: hypothetical protein WBL45_05670 [Solirubrobacterales bacterium]